MVILAFLIKFRFIIKDFNNPILSQIITINSPNVEGMTAIAAWMIVCIFFVFGALFGYAWLLWKKKKSCLKRHRKTKLSDEEGKISAKRKEETRSKTDDVFFVVFPLMFLLFNLVYWPMCLKGHENEISA